MDVVAVSPLGHLPEEATRHFLRAAIVGCLWCPSTTGTDPLVLARRFASPGGATMPTAAMANLGVDNDVNSVPISWRSIRRFAIAARRN